MQLPQTLIPRAAALLALFSFVATGGNGVAADANGLFDAPVHEKHIPLPPDSANPQAKPKLSCFIYPGFMVKQIDRGEKGAEQLSLLPLGGKPAPDCQEANAAGEVVVGGKEWSGYFKGAKGNYVFFDAADSVNSGIGFAIYNGESGAKLLDASTTNMHSVTLTPSGLAMRFTRVYSAECSLVEQGAACWEQVAKATGVTAPQPDCTASYKAAQTYYNTSAEQMAIDPSVIEFEAETVLDGDTAKTMTVAGAVICRPAE